MVQRVQGGQDFARRGQTFEGIRGVEGIRGSAGVRISLGGVELFKGIRGSEKQGVNGARLDVRDPLLPPLTPSLDPRLTPG